MTDPFAHENISKDESHVELRGKNHLVTQKREPMVPKRQNVDFQSIKAGKYFASRVLVDEALMKNYSRFNKDQIMKWIRKPQQSQIQSVIRQFG